MNQKYGSIRFLLGALKKPIFSTVLNQLFNEIVLSLLKHLKFRTLLIKFFEGGKAIFHNNQILKATIAQQASTVNRCLASSAVAQISQAQHGNHNERVFFTS